MNRNWYSRLLIVLAVTLGTLWLLVPSYYSFFVVDRADRNNVKKLDELLPAWAPPAKYRLSLGLDLQGGIHMVMRVDTATALMKRAERRGLQMVNWVETKKLGKVTLSTDPDNLKVTLTAEDPATMDAIEKELLSTFEDFSKDTRDGASLTLHLNDAQADNFKSEAVDQAMLVIRKRIDKWGVAEVDVRRLGNDSIQISLPGQSDPEAAKELIGTTAQLEFRLVYEDTGIFSKMFQDTPPDPASGITLVTAPPSGSDGSAPPTPFLEGADRQAMLEYIKDKSPEGQQILLHCVESENGKNCVKYYTFLLGHDVPLTGDSLTNADASQNPQDNSVQVNFQFDAQGAADLDSFTGNNVGKRMAIVLDDNVVMAPTIQERIGGGSGRITLGRAGAVQERLKEAQMLALALKAGALPAPVTTGEVRQVGASLGDEMIRKGGMAAGLGMLIVLVLMVVYYRGSGLIANVALVLNGVLIFAGLALFGATLTLPGIAGFVLTLGMAVDANVLIHERIREELQSGRSAQSAVEAGYGHTFWTIFDANLTTLIAAFILMGTGTGPVRGFATTLVIGILASLFTSIVVTRLIHDWLLDGRKVQTLSI